MRTVGEVLDRIQQLEAFAESLRHARDQMVPRFDSPGTPEAVEQFEQRLVRVERSIEELRGVLGDDWEPVSRAY